MMNVDKMDIIR